MRKPFQMTMVCHIWENTMVKETNWMNDMVLGERSFPTVIPTRDIMKMASGTGKEPTGEDLSLILHQAIMI